MTERGRFWVLALVALAACGESGPSGPNSISGSVDGIAWNRVEAAWWIGAPSMGSPPVILFLLEKRLSCAQISVVNWDKTIGDDRVLEIGLAEAAVRSFKVPDDAYQAYLRGLYNPDADGGTVTLTAVNPSLSLVGSFEARFRSETLRGRFEAAYCSTGVEP